ncbi:ParE family toxin-like protein [Candidatus Magnetominusculus xianensis]|uniref:ParE-like toxin domain-containing protein n=1 Tax=Candidatus Magnetominusculus xianensis TaxID=1748249 RepID=A0ABR5SC70_9BACT|nr:hypothetical protein [Candidatus Magnetominusculus xianensis]KWT75601.1 hypothetical protein ASN18_3201 [Candidatus Magnetominusculus xianensis]MBF0403684.1 hypothetical protein [Nitrospirota bacterium]
MKSYVLKSFWKYYDALPGKVKQNAKETYKSWLNNPFDEKLRFKKLYENKEVYSIRIGLYWRALGVKHGDDMYWFWIGSHEKYSKLIK